ncbi:DUF4251 domain-containing protein [Maribacter halichondriae]|uniref:DUF4251 domain-containing protein n=1 Tax=Maribacter halichondriae TaxID=2980554 RepID=UPI0023592FC3|nr:DUF4251 domain-containing protein [Maribacter sp. Hal144]
MIVRKIALVFSVTILMLHCSPSQKLVENNAALDGLIAQKRFEIKVRTVEPLVTQAMAQVANSGMLPPGNTISRIDVTGQGHFIKVHGDSVSANLPYFGERQMGGGYDDNPGIKFNAIPKNIEIIREDDKNRHRIKFTINDKTETFIINTEVYPNSSALVSIRSSHRNPIRYSGTVGELEE